MPGGWPATLACLAFRRVLPLAGWISAAVLILAVRWRESERAAELARLSGQAVAGADALVRNGLWTIATFLILPWCVARAAGTFARWRAGELDFLAPRAAPRAGLVLAAAVGHACAAFAVLALVLVAAEATSASHASQRAGGTVELARAGWITGTAPLASRLADADVAGAERIAVELVLGAGAGPAAEVVLRARRGAEELTARRRIGMRGRAEVGVPAGPGPLELTIEVGSADARVLLPAARADVWIGAPDVRSASVACLLELVLCAIAAGAVAFGTGAFLSPLLASLLTLSLWLVPGLLGLDPDWLPGTRLFAGLEILADGRVPRSPPLATVLGALAIASAGLALPCLGQTAWRRSR